MLHLFVVTCIAVLRVLSVYAQYTVTVRSSEYTLNLLHVIYIYMYIYSSVDCNELVVLVYNIL